MATQSNPSIEMIEQRLVALLQERILETQPGFGVESDLYANGLDSMAIMQTLILIEEEFRVVIPESDLIRRNFGTVRQLARLIGECHIRAACRQ